MALPALLSTIGRVIMRNPGSASAGLGSIGDLKKMTNQLGTIQDSIQVRVKGSQSADMKVLFRLAASVAFGRVRRLVPAGGRFNPLPPPGAISIAYSLTTKELVFSLRLNRSLLTASSAVFGAGTSALSLEPVFAGPSMTTIGGEWDFRPTFLPIGVGGVLGSTGPIAIQPLEFAGKVILTDQPVSPDPNPAISGTGPMGPTKHIRPHGDSRSRGQLVAMVTAALVSPVQFGPSTFVMPTDDNRFTGG